MRPPRTRYVPGPAPLPIAKQFPMAFRTSDPKAWSPPRHPVTVHAGFDLVYFGFALMSAAIVAAIWAIWVPPMLLLVIPFVVCASVAWWRWLSYRITVEPKGVRIGKMSGGAHLIEFREVSRVRFMRVAPSKGTVNWTSGMAARIDVPFETAPAYRPWVGAPLQLWIERRGRSDVRVNLDFLGDPRDIKLLYEALPHVAAPRFIEPTGPSESMPKWW